MFRTQSNRSVVRFIGVFAAVLGVVSPVLGQAGWLQEQRLLPCDGMAAPRFGNSVVIEGGTALIGAMGDDDNGASSGSAYKFEFNGSEWVEAQKLWAADGLVSARFGNSVAMDGNTAVIGAYHDLTTSGSAYVFGQCVPCSTDLDGDGIVGASDLLSLLVSWGPCKGCPADFDGNGAVGASDLLALLANWGPCP